MKNTMPVILGVIITLLVLTARAAETWAGFPISINANATTNLSPFAFALSVKPMNDFRSGFFKYPTDLAVLESKGKFIFYSGVGIEISTNDCQTVQQALRALKIPIKEEEWDPAYSPQLRIIKANSILQTPAYKSWKALLSVRLAPGDILLVSARGE